MYFFGSLKQIKLYESKYFCSICICFTLICTARSQTVGSAQNMALECVLSLGVFLCFPPFFLYIFWHMAALLQHTRMGSRSAPPPPTERGPRRGHQLGVHQKGQLLPLANGALDNPITVDSPLRMVAKGWGGWVTAIAPLFSVITNLYRGNGCLSGHEWKINRFNRVSFVW